MSYKGWIDVKWEPLTNVQGQVGHVLNNTISQFATHSTMVKATGLPVAAAFGFMPGLMFGLKRG